MSADVYRWSKLAWKILGSTCEFTRVFHYRLGHQNQHFAHFHVAFKEVAMPQARCTPHLVTPRQILTLFAEPLSLWQMIAIVVVPNLPFWASLSITFWSLNCLHDSTFSSWSRNQFRWIIHVHHVCCTCATLVPLKSGLRIFKDGKAMLWAPLHWFLPHVSWTWHTVQNWLLSGWMMLDVFVLWKNVDPRWNEVKLAELRPQEVQYCPKFLPELNDQAGFKWPRWIQICTPTLRGKKTGAESEQRNWTCRSPQTLSRELFSFTRWLELKVAVTMCLAKPSKSNITRGESKRTMFTVNSTVQNNHDE
jgi:hypothetical protein